MNKTISRYISRNILYPPLISNSPAKDLGMVVVIPCHNEPDIKSCLIALSDCEPPDCSVEVIVSINAGISTTDVVKNRNISSYHEVMALKEMCPHWLDFHVLLHNDLPNKKAGVGLGRKIGMDEAVRRMIRTENPMGIIVCFDADSSCETNYLRAIRSHFSDGQCESASIHYEHPIDGDEFDEETLNAIMQYELHLRYFIRCQKTLKLPYAYHTVGSSMACTVNAYCAVGGMNQRKAGEDFYFIHKLVKFGKHSELNSTKVIPSPRESDRVPFGTGRAIGVLNSSKDKRYFTCNPQSFIDLEDLVSSMLEMYESGRFSANLARGVSEFLESIKGEVELNRILANTSDYESFCKQFWHWFDAFLLMKYLHFVRDRYYPDLPVLDAVRQVGDEELVDVREALKYYRRIDVIR